MREGLLWFDKDPRRELGDKVSQAAKHYQAKFGCRPTICFVNVADFDGQSQEVHGVRLRTASNVLRYHLWIGVEGKANMARSF